MSPTLPGRFTLAHLSDPHLGPLPPLAPRHWNVKRGLGWVNWQRTRRHAHLPEVLSRILADMHARQPDHVAVTGDLANIGLPAEYEAATSWLATVGPPSRVSVVAGNHDVYCRLGGDVGVARWAAYMTGDGDALEPGASITGHAALASAFPYVRRLGGVAIVGVNSAIETRPVMAIGRVGGPQLERLAVILDRLGGERLVRVVLIHHPALPGQAEPTHALRDAGALESVVHGHGAELILFGHKHRWMLETRSTRTGVAVFAGVPSASLGVLHKKDHLAGWQLVHLTPGDPAAPIVLEQRGLAEPGGPIVGIARHEVGRKPLQDNRSIARSSMP